MSDDRAEFCFAAEGEFREYLIVFATAAAMIALYALIVGQCLSKT